MLSSSDDMAKPFRLLLHKGSADGVVILQNPQLIFEMVSGRCPVSAKFQDYFDRSDHLFVLEDDTLVAGYESAFASQALGGARVL
uniref:Uncharacterized protein n=1 Tax=Globisporangium ultimum (strain ATCC 200006 / CBS 805.95 / DAOM BR144) TaxID=431595 RepID=K3W7I9_GLOUD